jgi:GT2 family glycosyltransferase/ubiquinone/menaquinone biosynthesis C-methylase UbiE
MSADPTKHYGHARSEVQALVTPQAERILDIGCGAGILGAALKQRQDCEVWGVEVVPALGEQSQTRLDRTLTGDVEDAAILAQLPEDYFDVIVCANVLEYLHNPEIVLQQLQRCLREGGTIVACVPNVRHWSIIKDLLEGRWNTGDAGTIDRSQRHLFTASGLVTLFVDAGYEIGEAQAVRQLNETQIPEGLAASIAEFGIDTGNLEQESQALQFLLVCAPVSVAADVVSPVQDNAASAAAPQAETPTQIDSVSVTAAAETSDPVASLVMLARNQLDFTRSCIDSLFANTKTSFELIVVDNGSTDGTQQYLQTLIHANKPVRVISNPVNLGFGAGNNQGMAIARGQYIVLLNNDLVVTEGWLGRMIGHAERQEHIGIVGPVSNNVSGPQHLPNLDFTDYQQMHAHAAHVATSQGTKGFMLPRVVGFCMVIKRAVIDAIGGFDEDFGLGNFEDDDLCWRAITAGYGCFVASDTYIHHYGSRTFVGEKIDHSQCMQVAWTHFKKKWDLDENLKLGEDFKIPKIPFDAQIHKENLPNQGIVPVGVSGESPANLAERYNGWGQRLYERGKPQDARAFFQQALSVDSTCANALNNLGVIAIDENEVTQAAGFLERSVDNDQENADTLWNLIALYVHLGKDAQAKPLVQDYLRLNPEDEKALSLLQELEIVTTAGAPASN